MISMVKRLFCQHPVISNSVIYGMLYTGAEFSQQTVTRKIMVDHHQKDYSVDSLARFGLYGTCIQAPALYYCGLGIRMQSPQHNSARDATVFMVQSSPKPDAMPLAMFHQNQSDQPKGEPLPYDTGAIARYGVLGVGFYPAIYYYWYRWLDKTFRGRAATTIIKKMFLDQFLITPPLLVAFYISMSLMEGKENVIEECKSKMVPTFKTSCMFWLPAQALNFIVIPPAARVVYVGSCALIWVNILCWFKSQDY